MNKKLLLRLAILFSCYCCCFSDGYLPDDIRTIEYLTLFEPRVYSAIAERLTIGLVFDGLRLITLANVMEEKLTFKQIVNVVLSNYFLALANTGCQWRCDCSGYVHA